jgi:hypothetical protein
LEKFVQGLGCTASCKVAVEQVLILWWYSVQGRALGEERGECGIRCARVVLSNCVVEGEVEEGVEFGFDFFGDFWAFVCFMGCCAEWGVAEGAVR